MAMSPTPQSSPREIDPRGAERLRAATELSRTERTDRRWVEIEEAVLDRVLTASRPSHPVLGHSDAGPFHLSEQVLTYHLLRAADAVPRCEAAAIAVHTDEQQRCTGITVVVTARYGYSLLEIADDVRAAVRAAVPHVLGDVRPAVTVTDMHVHVHDITTGDPKRG